jgi:uncharacterized protein (TIGR02466 family)
MSQILELFSQPVYLSSDKYEISEKENECFKNVEANLNLLNYTSENHNFLEKEELKGLKEFVLKHIYNYHHNLMGFNKRAEIYITQSWLTITKPGEGHHLHRHPNSIYSGVYYLTKEHTQTQFHSPTKLSQQVTFRKERSTPYLEENLIVNATQGNLIIFPSNLAHDVKPNPSEKIRTTLSFNTWFKGEVGDHERLDYLKL